MPAKPIPDGYEGATPYLCCKDAANALEFYKTAFGAKELMRMPMPDGKIGHAEIQIGGARIMLSDEFPDWGCLSPLSIGGSATSVMIYFEDVDAVVERAVSAGAKVLQPVMDQFYGDRSCKLQDPSGHTWMFATHKEDVAPDELKKRAEAMSAEAASSIVEIVWNPQMTQIDADGEKDKWNPCGNRGRPGGRGSRRAVDSRLTGRFALPWVLEPVYREALGREFVEQAIPYERERALPIFHAVGPHHHLPVDFVRQAFDLRESASSGATHTHQPNL